jgi:hypothetical protein
MSVMLPRLLVLLCVAPPLASLPDWSWSTVQTYIHCANTTGEWNSEALQRLASQQFVVFEKNHKLFYSGPDGQANTSAETKIARSCQLVKQLNPRTQCLMYTELDVARTYYSLGHWFESHPESALHCPPGKLVQRNGVVQIDGSGRKHEFSFLAYDFTNPAGKQQWLKRATDAVATGYIDGVFIDGNKKNFSCEIIKPCSVTKRLQWSQAYKQTLIELARTLGPNRTVIANLVTPEDLSVSSGGMEEFGATNDWLGGHPEDVASRGIPAIMSWQRRRCGLWNQSCLLDFNALGSFETELANFLLGVYPHAFFGFGGGDGYWGGAGPDACKDWLSDHPGEYTDIDIPGTSNLLVLLWRHRSHALILRGERTLPFDLPVLTEAKNSAAAFLILVVAEYHRALGKPDAPTKIALSAQPGLNCSMLSSAIPDATDTSGCVYTRSFASGTRVYVGQFKPPKIDRHTKLSSNFGSCIFWSDGNITSPNAGDCPPRATFAMK